MQHHHDMSVALERHMPCRNFYNYMNGDMPCAQGNRDRWLSAFFSDVPRMQTIKAMRDPHNVFQSHLRSHGVALASQPEHAHSSAAGAVHLHATTQRRQLSESQRLEPAAPHVRSTGARRRRRASMSTPL
mmetsp:Transcript_74112/g.187416  ORF Transcript_74112/g.187416 Transcript_74112/m.187416 type:complete len:130 (-) Transcript_74112:160-549(-)